MLKKILFLGLMIKDYVMLTKASALELYKVKDAANAHIKKQS